MWNEDEDNNPYAYEQRDSDDEQVVSPAGDAKYGGQTPAQHTAANDSDGDEERPSPIQRKKGGYDSRIEQILYEHPELLIVITQAGKNVEGGGSYIAYTIRTGDFEVRRRYSDFYSLRKTLVDLHPTLIIPPIPEKHSMADYAAKPTKAKEDEAIIDHRKRMLASFLNRCKRIKQVREDGVFWRFLDPNASWNEVLHSPPVSSLPKNNLKAPPLDPANPSSGHNFLPIPASNAKLKSAKDSASSASGTPTAMSSSAFSPTLGPTATLTTDPQVFGKFPAQSKDMSEEELDPYFVNFENSSKELESFLQGGMDKINKRTLSHLNAYSEDLAELGARLNGFSLSEQSSTLAVAIEKMGQAVDSTYLATSELSSALAAGFSEPMRESSQFAGIVRTVLRFRILKRIQEEMTKDELEKKKALLEQLERSELESQRLGRHLESSGYLGPPAQQPRRSSSSSTPPRSSADYNRAEEDNASIDSDFPPRTSADIPSPEATSPQRKASSGGNFVTNKIFGRINHAIHGIVDVDPERTRRDQIGKTKESLSQLEQALVVSGQDVKDASVGVMRSLQDFQGEKEDDLRRYMIAFAKCHIEWAEKNISAWEEAKQEVRNIDVR